MFGLAVVDVVAAAAVVVVFVVVAARMLTKITFCSDKGKIFQVFWQSRLLDTFFIVLDETVRKKFTVKITV